MSEEKKTDAANIKVDSKLRSQMARAMWTADTKSTEFASSEEKGKKYEEVRDEYRKRAGAIIRIMMRRGVQMTAAPAAPGDAD